MKKFKQGDVVVLNSGGFLMTVKGYVKDHLAEETSWVEVVWFDNDEKKERKFHEDSLSIPKFWG